MGVRGIGLGDARPLRGLARPYLKLAASARLQNQLSARNANHRPRTMPRVEDAHDVRGVPVAAVRRADQRRELHHVAQAEGLVLRCQDVGHGTDTVRTRNLLPRCIK